MQTPTNKKTQTENNKKQQIKLIIISSKIQNTEAHPEMKRLKRNYAKYEAAVVEVTWKPRRVHIWELDPYLAAGAQTFSGAVHPSPITDLR